MSYSQTDERFQEDPNRRRTGLRRQRITAVTKSSIELPRRDYLAQVSVISRLRIRSIVQGITPRIQEGLQESRVARHRRSEINERTSASSSAFRSLPWRSRRRDTRTRTLRAPRERGDPPPHIADCQNPYYSIRHDDSR